jgi:hypothetical protein
MTFLYVRSRLAHAGVPCSSIKVKKVKRLSKLWHLALVQRIAEVFVSQWRELLICAAAVVAILILIIERNGNLP